MPASTISDAIKKRRIALVKKEGIENEILSRAESSSQIQELAGALKEGKTDSVKPILIEMVGYAPQDYVTRISIQDVASGKMLYRVGEAVTSLKPATKELGSNGKPTYLLKVESAPAARVDSSFNVIWLGVESSGKSSLIERMKQGEFVPASATIGLNVTTFFSEGVKLVNCDVSGHKSFRSIWDSLIVGSPDLMVYVIDASDSSMLEEAKNVLMNYALKADILSRIPVLIVANKQDVEGALNAEQLSSKLSLPQLIQGREWKVVATSTKTGVGIPEILEWILQRIKTNKDVITQ
jgi:GTPase SAR1 family protein